MIAPTEALASWGNASTISNTAGIETPGKPVKVTVPVGGSAAAVSELQVVLDPNSGALLSSTALDRVATDGTISATFSPEAAISYGPVSVVQSTGALPNATK